MKSLNYLLAEVKIEKFSNCETQHLPFLPGGGMLTGKAIRKTAPVWTQRMIPRHGMSSQIDFPLTVPFNTLLFEENIQKKDA